MTVSVKFFAALFIILHASPFLGYVFLESMVPEGEECFFEYEPQIEYWQGHSGNVFEAPLRVADGNFVFGMAHLANYGKSGLFLRVILDDPICNLRKVTLEIAFTDSQTNTKFFEEVTPGVGDPTEGFENFKGRTRDDVFVYKEGKALSWDFSIRDFIKVRHNRRTADFLTFSMVLNDVGDPVSYFNTGDVISFHITVQTVEYDLYFGMYEKFIILVMVLIVYCDYYIVMRRMKFKEVFSDE